jgi:hypothetical protein
MSFETELAREYVVHRISVKHGPVVRTLGDAINYLHSYGAGSKGGAYQELDRLLYEAVRTGTAGDVMDATEAFERYWA